MIDLNQGEMDWLSKHMGHETDLHKMAYRLHTSMVELTKVGKVLNVLDSTAEGKQQLLHNLKSKFLIPAARLPLLLNINNYIATKF